MLSQAESIAPVEPRLSDKDIQDMLAKSVRLYAERAVERDGGLSFRARRGDGDGGHGDGHGHAKGRESASL